jgi:hypothetical protein
VAKVLLNAALFQVAWFAAVLGAAYDRFWLGPLVLLPVLAVNLVMASERRSELQLWAVAGVIGLLFDTVLVAAGVFAPRRHLFPFPFSPPWMIGLWLNFAATLNRSLGWLHGRPLPAALFGAVGGPLAYYGGARLGATETIPGVEGLLILATGWGIITPLLFKLAGKLRSSTCCRD